MFGPRLLTTLVLIPLVLCGIYYANQWVLTAFILIIMLGCGWEWLHLIPVNNLWVKTGFLIALLLFFGLSDYQFGSWLWAGGVFWLLILFAELSYPQSQSVWGYPWIVAVAGLFLLPMFARSLQLIAFQPQGKALVIYLLFLVWATDIGAYLVGKQWGKHKLIPRVSPGKTREGFVGGFLLSLLVAVVGFIYFQPASLGNWFIIAIIVILGSMIGDLFISMLKRRRNLKDTGHLIPGHGGILDRLDSLIAASTLFYGGFLLLNPNKLLL